MKILQVVHGFLPQFRGGTELYVYGLARKLRRLGHDVEIATGTTDTADEPRLETYEHEALPVYKIVLSGSYLEHWTRSLAPAASRLFREVLEKSRPDLVHVHHWFRLSRDLIEVCHDVGIPAVCTLHDLWASCPRIFRIRQETFCERPLGRESCTDCVPRLPWMEDADVGADVDLFRDDFRQELALAHRIIVPSRSHGDVVRKVLDLPPDRFVVLPHGTITSMTPPAPAPADEAPAAPPNRARNAPIRVGVWSHLSHMKGAHLLLEALHALGPKRSRFDVHVWGEVVEPGYGKRLAAAAKDLEVTWHGSFVPADLGRQPLDLAIIPSLCSESFSFVLDEAFALGLPAVVSGRGALAERIGQAGTTFVPESADDLAKVLGRIADDPRVLNRWRAAIPELTTLTWHARELGELYRVVHKQARDAGLVKDPTLARRRLEHLTASLGRRERMMFGYLGHMKRESGRADHYEEATKAAIARQHELGAEIGRAKAEASAEREAASHLRTLVETLGGEIEAFRRLLRLREEDLAGFERPMPAVPDLAEHVPGLGPIRTILRENHDVISVYVRRVGTDERQRANVALVAFLTERIVELRGALGQVGERSPRLPETAPVLPEVANDLPGLGAPATILADDQRVIAESFERLREQRRREERLVAVLGRELEVYGQALALAGMDAVPRAVPESTTVTGEAAIPEYDVVEGVLGGSHERLVQYVGHLRGLHQRLARAATLEKALAAVANLVVDLRKMLASVAAAEREVPPARVAPVEARALEVLGLGPLGEAMVATSDVMRRAAEDLRVLHVRLARATDETELTAARTALVRKDRLIAGLAARVDELRRAVGLVFLDDPRFVPVEVDADETGDHVPGLGDLVTIREVDLRLIDEHVERLRDLMGLRSGPESADASDDPMLPRSSAVAPLDGVDEMGDLPAAAASTEGEEVDPYGDAP